MSVPVATLPAPPASKIATVALRLLDRVPMLRGRFARDTLALVVGLGAAQSISIIGAPILTRLYTPTEFGIFSAFSTLVGTVGVLACLTYEAAIVLPKEDEDAGTLVALCAVIAVTVASIAALAGAGAAPRIAALVKSPPLAGWLAWAPAMLLAIGFYQAWTYWCTRRRQFVRIGLSRIGQALGTFVVQVAGHGPGGLIAGAVVGQVVGTACVVAGQRPGSRWTRRIAEMTEALTRYRQFPMYSSWGTFMSVGSYQAVPLLLATFFGPATAGLYFLVYRLASLPMSLVGTAMGQVILQRAAERCAAGESLAGLVEQSLATMIRAAIIPFAALALVAPPVFGWLFGQAWIESGSFLRLMVPLFFMQFLTAPVSMVLIALERQRTVALVQAAMFAGALAAIFTGARLFGTPTATLTTYVLMQSLIYVGYLATVLRASNASAAAVARAVVAGRS